MGDQGRGIVAACLLAALLITVGAGEADAGSGIVVTDTTIMPSGDPLAVYDFKLALGPGITLAQGDNLVLLNIPDFNADPNLAPSYVFASGNVDYGQFFAISTVAGTAGTNVVLSFTAAPPLQLVNSGATLLAIGDLFVQTTVDFSMVSGSALLAPISYTSTTTPYGSSTPSTGSGITVTPSVVPEPSSLALLGVGMVAPWLLAGRRRRPARRG